MIRKNMPASISLLAIILLSCLMSFLLISWQIAAHRMRVINQAFQARIESQLCDGVAQIGVQLAKEWALNPSSNGEKKVLIPIPQQIGKDYAGLVLLMEANPMTIKAQLLKGGQPIKSINISLGQLTDQGQIPVLTWQIA